jgi:hypothetical protein
MPFRIAPWLLAAALGPLPVVVRADVAFSTTLTHFGWSLTDLRPGDGIAPALDFVPFNGRDNAFASVNLRQATRRPGSNFPDIVQPFDYREAPGAVPFPALQAGIALPHAEGSAQSGGDGAAHGFSAAVRGRAHVGASDTTIEDASAWSYLAAMPVSERRDLPNVLLTPYTHVVWSGDVSLSARHTPHPAGGPREIGDAVLSVALFDPVQERSLGLVYEQISLRPGGPAERHRDLHMRLEWTNDSADVAGAQLFVQLLAHGDYVATSPPVPEPGTWALLASGLGVVGSIAARRRTRPGA